MKVKPLFDRVVIEEIKETQTQSGIFLGATDQDCPKTGTVVYVGPGNQNDNGNYSKMFVKEGDKVIYSRYAGGDTIIDKKHYCIIRQTDILAILED